MIELGYTTKLDKILRNVDFPRKYLNEWDIGFIQHFRRWEEWEKLSISDRMQRRKGEIVHLKKINVASTISYEYLETLIKLSDLILDFLEKTEPLFFDEEKIIKMDKDEIKLFCLHAYLYCELYAINKEHDLREIKHTLTINIIDPIFEYLKMTEYYKLYNIEEIELTNKNLRELYKQKPY